MTFGRSIQTVFTRYAEFGGRAGRPEFWWWILFTTLVSAVLSPVPTWSFELSEGAVLTGPTLSGLWSLVVLLPTIAVTVRRLRDAGYAWTHALWLLIPLAGLIVVAVLCAQPSRLAMRSDSTVDAPGVLGPSR